MRPPPIYPQLPHLHNHDPISDYASTASISTGMTMSFHLKRKFLKKWYFSSSIIKTPQVLKRQSIKKREKNYWKKERKKRKKKKAPRVSSNKGEVNILRGENVTPSF
jgi:hypothetical protein